MDPATLSLILSLAVKYGPEFVLEVIALFKKKELTIDDVEALFKNVKPYSAYGIPDVVPTVAKPA
jgi:hypothetical protein